MVRSLWNAATGMNGQQMNIDTISNNLSNVNTTGFKQHRAEFEDLIYQNVKLAGTPATEDTVTPVGHQMGSGVKVGATQRIMSQGSLQATGVDTDIAIVGDGFFRVQQPAHCAQRALGCAAGHCLFPAGAADAGRSQRQGGAFHYARFAFYLSGRDSARSAGLHRCVCRRG